jgi:cholesterol oxidase
MAERPQRDYDYIIVGSGFGGSVSACRLAEKGYRVLVVEKGRRWRDDDFPRTNWNLRRWLWMPLLRLFGFFKITFFRHVTVLSGVGVGGGSLVYANVLARPKRPFFASATWSHLADWEQELAPYYDRAFRMLGGAQNPRLQVGDTALQQIAEELGRSEYFAPTDVSVFFGEPEVTVPDPFFDGEGPERTGCHFCGACMIGCRHGAKNTLPKTYLHLAERRGARILAESEVYDVRPLGAPDGSEGYEVRWRRSTGFFGRKGSATCHGVIFAGGVLGTMSLLLRLKQTSLPRLSDRLGSGVRTNSEALLGVTSPRRDADFSEGIAIGSILYLDENTHVEPVRYPSGSGFWRLLIAPMVSGKRIWTRVGQILGDLLRHPWRNLRVLLVWDWARHSQILLFMQSIDSVLRLRRGLFGLRTSMDEGEAPSAAIPQATSITRRYGEILDAKPQALVTESLFGIPTTAHILGGAVMGASPEEGVIDKDNRVFGYANMLICDGSMISANLGVNPSLTITALTERAMDRIPPRTEAT